MNLVARYFQFTMKSSFLFELMEPKESEDRAVISHFMIRIQNETSTMQETSTMLSAMTE